MAFQDMVPVKKAKMKKDCKKELDDISIVAPVLSSMGPSRIIFVDVGSTLLWTRSYNTFYPGMVGLAQTAWPRQGLLLHCLLSVYFFTFKTFQFSVIQNQ